MTLTLKNVKELKELSQETVCFSASIYWNGKRVAEVSNRGHGGPNEYHWFDRAAEAEVWEYARDTIKDYDFEQLDIVVGDLVYEAEVKKKLKNWCATKTVYKLKSDEKGSFRLLETRFYQGIADQLRRKYGDQLDVIFNEELNLPPIN